MRIKSLVLLFLLLFVVSGCNKPAEEKKEEKTEANEADKEKAEGEDKEAKDEPAGDEAKDEKKVEAKDDAKKDEPVEEKTEPAKDEPKEDVKPAVAAVGSVNPFLAEIPADTPYAMASLKVMDYESSPFQLEQFKPAMVKFAEMLKDMPDVPPVVTALMEEFGTNFSREGFESLGLSLEAHSVIYGVGVFPVFRMTLKDGAVFDAAMKRIEEKGNLKPEMRDLGGVKYRYYNIENELAIAVAVIDNNLAVTAATPDALDWVLGYAFGQTKPEKSILDAGTFAELEKRYGANDALSIGFVDLMGIEKVLAGEAQNLVTESLKKLGAPLPLLQGDCATEFGAMAAGMPRVYFASTFMGKKMDVDLVFEIKDAGLMADLKKVQASIPSMGSMPAAGTFGVFGIAFDLASGIEVLKARMNAMAAAPYKCEYLAELNDAIAEGSKEIEANLDPAGLPPFVMGLKGAYVVVEDFTMGQGGMPTDVKALALVGVDNPAGTWQQLAGMVPFFAGVELGAGATALPAIPQAPMVKAPHAMANDKVLALSVGEGMNAKLEGFASGKAEGTPLMVFGYDYARFMEVVGPTMDAEAKEMMDYMSGVTESLGFLLMQVGINDYGVHMSYGMEMK